MDRQDIVRKVNEMETKTDLLSLLNELKADDLGDRAYPFTMKQLNYYCNPNKTNRRYTQFEIPKKSGGKRQITAPVKTLKSLLTYINVVLQAMYEPAPCVMGFTSGKSIADNAKAHIGKHYVFNIDLKDFFPSIAQARVWKKLQCPPFNFKNDEEQGMKRRVLADVIAGLCCMKVDEKTYVLPQGAPTSPVLTNIICERLDRRLTGLANRFGVTYTRYADDITFSSMHNVYQDDSEFMKELDRIVEGQGFTINTTKTRIARTNQRQEVTGLTVNEKPNVTRKYVQDVRHVLHTWQTKGYMQAYADFLPHYKSEKGHVKKGEPVLENVISGKLDYLKMIKGEGDSTYQRLKGTFDLLMQQRNNENVQFVDAKYRYVMTYSIPQFEDTLKTELKAAASKTDKKYLFFILDGKKNMVSISKNMNVDDIEGRKRAYAISLCETASGKRFYLVHRPIENEKVTHKNEISLNETLDKLVSSDFTNLEILLDDGTR